MKRKKILTPLIIFIIFILISSALFYYNNYLQTKLEEQTCEILDEVLLQQMYNFEQKFSNDKRAMKGFAGIIAEKDYTDEQLIVLMKKLALNTDFENISFARPNGDAFSSVDLKINISDREYFQQALAGETVVSEPILSKIRNDTIIVVATPINKFGKIIGVLTGSYKSELLNVLFLPSFNDAGYAYATTNDGEIIAQSSNSFSYVDGNNLFSFWENADFYDDDGFPTIKENLYNDVGGHSKYFYKGKKRYMHYATLAVNQWNIFSITPEEALKKTSNDIILASGILTLIIGILFLSFTLYGFFMQKGHIRQLSKIAYYDELTDSATLTKFKIDAQNILDENPKSHFVLVKNDVDNFKLLNQVLGFEIGDKVLNGVARAFESCVKSNNELVARYNVDEFIYLHEFITQEDFDDIRQKYFDSFNNYMGESFAYSIKFVSGHYYLFEDECNDISEAIERVNLAHRKAKRLGLPKFVYDNSVVEDAMKKKEIENHMEMALENQEYLLYLQPKYVLANEVIGGAEALVRWNSSELGFITPDNFIPVFEENGFITKLDMYIFEKTCILMKDWIKEGKKVVTISVNFSRLHIENPEFVSSLCVIADYYKVPRHLLEIELTESTMFNNEIALIKVLDDLHEAGFTLSMDDFGSGYSSLGLLKNLPFDVLKLDRSFFLTANNNKRALAVLSNVLNMARALGIYTVAEGVETKEHIDLLKELKCDMVQGYYYSKPLPINDFVLLI